MSSLLKYSSYTPLLVFILSFSHNAYSVTCADGNPSASSVIGDSVRDPGDDSCVNISGSISYADIGYQDSEASEANYINTTNSSAPNYVDITLNDTVYLLGDNDEAILLKNMVGDIVFGINEANGSIDATLKEVGRTSTNAGSGLVSNVDLMTIGDDPSDGGTSFTSYNVTRNIVTAPASTGGDAAVTFDPADAITGAPINELNRASGGDSGGNAWIFGNAGDGDNGSTGPTVDRAIATSHGSVITASNGTQGVKVGSLGGNGGNGGSAYALIGNGGDGGIGGSGGQVSVDTEINVTTKNSQSSAVYVVSQSGNGGSAGSGGLFGDGGDGGSSRNGGTVDVDNSGTLVTEGENSHGLQAFSSGGSGGSGGSSVGIVGSGGTGASAGNGGIVSVENSGDISTEGNNSNGVLAQSIGGTGGDGGLGAGIVTWGGQAGSGGESNSVTVLLSNGSHIETSGTNSSGVVAQSIGGGGGSAGSAGGLVAFGASSGAGNSAEKVDVITESNTSISTENAYSHGILAQSIGGGGGNAGDVGGIVALGGDAGQGGNAKAVTVTNAGDITTDGVFSHGTMVQSIGGGGGAGGGAGGLVAFGGDSGTGGNADIVTVTNEFTGTTITKGAQSAAIFAQSIGGGGGAASGVGGLVAFGGDASSGGNAGNVSVTNYGNLITENTESKGIFAQSIGGGGGAASGTGGVVAFGGSAGSGSVAGSVTVDNKSVALDLSIPDTITSGQISTEGQYSDAIFAQSIGGGGGSTSGTGGVVAFGGEAGVGGNGLNVDIDNDGKLFTKGDFSRGIFAQSIGGGGGSGGDTGGVVAFGGSTGAGGNADQVEINGSGNIETAGKFSDGVFAQSVGGGGGSGGFAGGLVSFGKSGGSGGASSGVSVDYAGNVTTDGDFSRGIFAQSIGGGGGAGGDAGGAVSLGGSSDDDNSGGNAGSVNVISNGAITTNKKSSEGIFAQSIGGGGGSGGDSGGLVTIGGSGSSGGNAGNVSVTNTGAITTGGENSDGIFAQSIAGGGGNGGNGTAIIGPVAIGGSSDDGGVAGKVTVENTGTVVTTGDDSRGVFAQSVGGGGGNGGAATAASLFAGVAIGGDGGNGGAGGKVVIELDKSIVDADLATSSVTTSGDRATGIFAQSVGGGGGSGGDTIAISVGYTGSASVSLGGEGGDGGAGGDVSIEGSGSVTTNKSLSTGILMQSVGGGGGDGGMAISGSLAIGETAGIAVAVAIGGDGGKGGAGGKVSTIAPATSASPTPDYSDFNITTLGNLSTGFLAQSVGGGGGNGGVNAAVGAGIGGAAGAGVAVGLGGTGGEGGDGGVVDIAFGGNIETYGDQSDAIVVQSVGGGGGNGGNTVAASLALGGAGAGAVSAGIGGDGGDGGLAETVTTKIMADVTTDGDGSGGLVAQAIGGGGGNGGMSIAASGSGGGVGAVSVSVTVGGKAGGGGDSNTVTAEYDGTMLTSGANSTGILAQAVGGGGGNGGGVISASISGAGAGTAAVAVGIGGEGGDGGLGGEVDLTTGGSVTTEGDNSAGIIAQSVGGGGGSGGYSITAAVSGAGAGAASVAVGLGGKGGLGQNGGDVVANLNADVSTGSETGGDNSTGVIIQSIGGGGGNGGMSVTAAMAGGGAGAGTVSVGIGGDGAGGGDAGTVNATMAANVSTTGNNSAGFVAQTVGGGGGNGGMNISAGLSGGGAGAGSVNVGLGGKADGGGDANVVIASYSGTLTTGGSNSTGIVAQAIGGGGGNGGMTVSAALSGAGVGAGAVSVGLGGTAGDGGIGGSATEDVAVDLTTTGTVTTLGSESTGIVAQSIGGGGGNGGMSISASASGAGTGAGAVSVGLGGDGGKGGDAKNVKTNINSNISTAGSNSSGAVIQSIGGGGGNGGMTVTAALSGAGVGAGGVTVGLGGSGSGGGNAGKVEATLISDISTISENSSGIVLQSIGGGGGNGGLSVSASGTGAGTGAGSLAIGLGGDAAKGGNSDEVIATYTGNLSTSGNNSTGVLAQAVGGGGGNGGGTVTATLTGAGTGTGAVSVGLGGSGGDGGLGGLIDLITSGTIATAGNDSAGIVAQSIGGGGGSGGYSITAAGAGAGTGAGSVSVGLGGSGGIGQHADLVKATINSDISTLGTNSVGALIQSVGGGGGNGGMTVTAAMAGAGTGAGAVTVGLGGKGSGGGDAGEVQANVIGNVSTSGRNSSGLVMQSIGGGGGNGGLSISATAVGAGTGAGAISIGLGGLGDDGGDAKKVDGSYSGTVITNGVNSTGILAQSIGGGGGNGGGTVTAALSGAGTGAGAVALGIGGNGGGGGFAGEVVLDTYGNVTTNGSESMGIVAQSIGGGGGNGGYSITATASGAGTGAGTVSVGLGGSGDVGGDGNTVNLNVNSQVTTRGANNAGAILAQSVGGGGGNGGMTVSASVVAGGTGAGAGSVGLGGSGDGGGDGKTVSVNVSTTTLSTIGNNSAGLVSQSIGGGGGNGGMSVTAAIAGGGTGAGAATVGIGGSGAGGGNGGTVITTATISAFISTRGEDSTGILSQSVGGGGGNGGMSVAATLVGAGKGSAGASVGIGGSGAGGGNGGIVSANIDSIIITAGKGSSGVVSQSVGGGGGNGGMNVSGTFTAAGTGSGGISVGLGGSGGTGGKGSRVDNTFTGYVNTAGSDAVGLLAQSVGGGGGNGGMVVSGAISLAGKGSGSAAVGIGGSGGAGGLAGEVVNSVNGTAGTRIVETTGASSSGIVAQSIGGGGGNGGLTIAGTIAGSGKGAGGVAVAIGGSGGSGGISNTVTNTVTGDVMTLGQDSKGVVAQSIGGGGGDGSITVSGAVSLSNSGSGAVAVGIGGSGGTGGGAGVVHNTLLGNILTQGSDSTGVLAQSLGGGGGNGGIAIAGSLSASKTGSGAISVGVGGSGGTGGSAANVTSDVTGNVVTYGSTSIGVLAQSVGGGGGNGGTAIAGAVSIAHNGASGAIGVGVGGSGGAGSTSGAIDNSVTGNVITAGKDSSGVVAQSIGGGGGNGGMAIAGSLSAGKKGSGAISVGVGGSGGSGGSASTVDNRVDGTVNTLGENSMGVLAQSVGGGGGKGGMSVAGAVSFSSNESSVSGAIGIGVGGSGGDGSTSAAVTNRVTGSVVTSGSNAAGVVAQSIGGGGGNGNMTIAGTLSGSKKNSGAISVGVGGSGGSGGSSSTVNNTVIGNITTSGDRATGILAQSVGGGGGSGGMTVSGSVSLAGENSGALGVGIGGTGGDGGISSKVTNALDGNVTTRGIGASGVVAQSIGGGGGNGGVAISGSLSASKKNSGALAIGIGGAGGTGSQSGEVHNTVEGQIITTGEDAIGVLAQSVGGGGGNGGLSVAGSISAAITGSSKESVSAAVGVGGFGGGGGDASNVTNNITGYVRTEGAGATGILGQSIGGGGGNGGMNVAGAVSFSQKGGGTALGLGVGGFGGDGGNGGNVSSTVIASGTNSLFTTLGHDAVAIMAQSVGGSGGNGGINIAGALTYADEAGASIGIGVGGFGGGGGNAGNTSLNVNGNVQTAGNNSHAVVAQSLGGGGGNGGLNVAGGIAFSKTKNSTVVSIGIGGFGGDGGHAGNVVLEYQGTINTAWNLTDSVGNLTPDPSVNAKGSYGVLAQSLGGGGGNGGINISSGISYAKASDGEGNALLFGLGGFGGSGGNAGRVMLNVTGNNSITAHGDESSAIMAQSLGGGGGNGAINVTGGIVSGAPIFVGIGGFGGDGGFSGDVNVDAITDVYANGINSTGITAQSIGGGGGNGGLNVTAGGIKNSEDTSSSLFFGVGGFGGAGNVSGNVDVAQSGQINTRGENAHGIFAQAIAGGGGNGGINITAGVNWSTEPDKSSQNLAVVGGIGGHGGTGADAGNVLVDSMGDIRVTGEQARGIFAQSIGGGGGNGGANVTANITKEANPVSLGIGGFGSGGGHAGNVTVIRGTDEASAGTIFTEYVEKVLGTLSIDFDPIDGFGICDLIGTCSIDKEVEIAASNSHGIEASSIGGGGGDAGWNLNFSYSKAGTPNTKTSSRSVPKHNGVDDKTNDNYSKVMDELECKIANKTYPCQSSGSNSSSDADSANDKKSAYAMNIAIGGAGGEAGDGGEVIVDTHTDIVTRNSSSYGILAQSIGGGGGNASMNVAYTKAKNAKTLNIGVGGAVGDGGIGKSVSVVHQGHIVTHGQESVGILAQSVGGGGGNAGMNVITGGSDSGIINLVIGRQGGTGGEGGNIAVDFDGELSTLGDRAHGIQAQSIGNGGGNSSKTSLSAEAPVNSDLPVDKVNIKVGLTGGEGGFSASVDVKASGFITTAGDNAFGVIAQSIGGGGGNASSSKKEAIKGISGHQSQLNISLGGDGGVGGYSGDVQVVSDAVIKTQGGNASGIFAQSIGGGGGTGATIYLGGKLKNKKVKTDDKTTTKPKAASAYVLAIGGTGGEGAISDAVTVNNSGIILTGVDSGGTAVTAGELSHGILAQSIGGGGGNAGGVTNVISNSTEGSGTARIIALAIGGTGGEGAAGDEVIVENTGGIETFLQRSVGIFAQSIGGGGGNASSVITTSASGKEETSINIALGASGGVGAAASNVRVANLSDGTDFSGVVVTHGHGAHGIAAMSIGGGGGEAASTVAGNIGNSVDGKGVAIAIGGSGGTGGVSGPVTVENSGVIVTYGDAAHGILAQSIGGGGGNAASVIATSQRKNENSNVAYSIGGSGGTGNRSGNVMVNNSGDIRTVGTKSYGVLAQSIGGGGGNGSKSASYASGTFNADASALRNIAIGGFGGDGSDSGDVIIDHSGTITIEGDHSYGIYAQSVSGGGGTMGYSVSTPITTVATNVFKLASGGDGTDGVAGTVEVNVTGNINVLGNNSNAVFTQSINGGGGDVQLFMDLSMDAMTAGEGTVDVPDNPSELEEMMGIVDDVLVFSGLDGVIEAGSKFVEDAQGAVIDFIQEGETLVYGDDSDGIHVQTIGAGGGNNHINLTLYNEQKTDLNAALGSEESLDSSGGDIDYQRQGSIGTSGTRSDGASIQSIGGGGGSIDVILNELESPELESLESATPITLDKDIGKQKGLLSRRLTENALILKPTAAQTMNIALGAVGGKNNDGGNIDLVFNGDVLTQGDRSLGLILQSIGAGGGDARLTGIDTLTVGLGATDSGHGNGGKVSFTNVGTLQTEGVMAHGMVVQSIGGGGGFVLTDTKESQITLNSQADNSGAGGSIELHQTGNVIVQGNDATAVIVQSIGGGGGLVDTLFAGSAGGEGTGGAIDISFDGSITALGENGRGILVQSIGKSGSGDLNVSVNGDVITTGNTSIAVELQSTSENGNGDITFENKDGDIIYAGEGGVAIALIGGNNNTLTLNGTVGTADGLEGMAIQVTSELDSVDDLEGLPIQATSKTNTNTLTKSKREESTANEPYYGSNTIVNTGMVYGEFDLGLGVNTFTNNDEAYFVSGKNIKLGAADSMFTNHGVMNLGDSLNAQVTRLDGSYTQTEQGMLYAELDFNSDTMDQLIASGYISIAGEVNLSLLSPQLVPYGRFNHVLFKGDKGIENDDFVFNTASSVVINYQLNDDIENTLSVDYDVDFARDWLSKNLQGTGQHFNWIQAAGSSEALEDVVVSLLYAPTEDVYRQLLTQMSPDLYAQEQAGLLISAQRFNEQLFSCKSVAQAIVKADDGSCYWMDYSSEDRDIDAHGDHKAFEQDISEWTIGMKEPISEQVELGFSVSKLTTHTKGNNAWTSNAKSVFIGAYVGYEFENNWELSASLSYGNHDVTSSRIGQVVDVFRANVERELEIYSSQVRLTKEYLFDGLYLKPRIELGLNQLEISAAHEIGADALNLRLNKDNERFTWMRPALSAGWVTKFDEDSYLDLFIDLSVLRYFGQSDTFVHSSLQGAPDGVLPMSVSANMGESVRQASINLSLIRRNSWQLLLAYMLQDGYHYSSRNRQIKIVIPF